MSGHNAEWAAYYQEQQRLAALRNQQQRQLQHQRPPQTTPSFQSNSTAYSPYQYYTQAAQQAQTANNTTTWIPSGVAPRPHPPLPPPRGQGMSYADLLAKAEIETGTKIIASNTSRPLSSRPYASVAASSISNQPPSSSYQGVQSAQHFQQPQCTPLPPSMAQSSSYELPPKQNQALMSKHAFQQHQNQPPLPPPPPNPSSPPAEGVSFHSTSVCPSITYEATNSVVSSHAFEETKSSSSNSSVPSTTPAAAPSYPPRLIKHVERAFANCKNEHEKAIVQKSLKKSIERAASEGRLWSLDWDAVPLPLCGSKRKQTMAANLEIVVSDTKLSSKMSKKQLKKLEKLRKKQKKNFLRTDLIMDAESLAERNARFGPMMRPAEAKKRKLRLAFGNSGDDSADIDLNWEKLKINGTCTKLEKEYLRLTSAPDPAVVRPEHILKKSLKLLMSKWKKDCGYLHFCQQMKSIRQDITIQHILNEFTIEVYEINARVCLEVGDLSEYNQCQTQLKALYKDMPTLNANQNEFISYQLYYYMSTNDVASVMHHLSEIPNAAQFHPLVCAAISVYRTIIDNNYKGFFTLFNTLSVFARTILKNCATRLRFRALQCCVRAYRPTFAVSLACKVLNIESEDLCLTYLVGSGAVLSEDDTMILVKQSAQLNIVDITELLEDDEGIDSGITHGSF